MTKQEIFERVYIHLMRQGCKSVIQTPRGIDYPVYYGEYGLKCAIGCLIPQEEYQRDWERHPLERVLARCSTFRGIDDAHGLLFMLRACHDTLKPSCWKTRLAWIAKKQGLVVTEALQQLDVR